VDGVVLCAQYLQCLVCPNTLQTNALCHLHQVVWQAAGSNSLAAQLHGLLKLRARYEQDNTKVRAQVTKLLRGAQCQYGLSP
jgi:hypothetical protein